MAILVFITIWILQPKWSGPKVVILTIFVPGGRGDKFAPPLSYFSIDSKLNKTFALMHPDFESNLITHIFRNFGVIGTTGSDVIFAFVGGTQGVLCSFEHDACLSVCIVCLLYCVFIIDANL